MANQVKYEIMTNQEETAPGTLTGGNVSIYNPSTGTITLGTVGGGVGGQSSMNVVQSGPTGSTILVQPPSTIDQSGCSSGGTEAQEMLNDFWPRVMNEIEGLTTNDFKQQELPLARIKKIMKLDDDVKSMMISAEAPVLFAKAAEIFITEISLRAWIHTEENKRRTLQRNDISMAITKYDQFDFLIDIVPRDESTKPQSNNNSNKRSSNSDGSELNLTGTGLTLGQPGGLSIGNQGLTFNGQGLTFNGQGLTLNGQGLNLGGQGLTLGPQGLTLGGQHGLTLGGQQGITLGGQQGLVLGGNPGEQLQLFFQPLFNNPQQQQQLSNNTLTTNNQVPNNDPPPLPNDNNPITSDNVSNDSLSNEPLS